jgi:hypothetical protein
MPNNKTQGGMPQYLEFGVFAPKLSEQLKNTNIPKEQLEHFDLDADAINRLLIRGVLTDSQTEQARKKLLKRIVNNKAK